MIRMLVFPHCLALPLSINLLTNATTNFQLLRAINKNSFCRKQRKEGIIFCHCPLFPSMKFVTFIWYPRVIKNKTKQYNNLVHSLLHSFFIKRYPHSWANRECTELISYLKHNFLYHLKRKLTGTIQTKTKNGVNN